MLPLWMGGEGETAMTESYGTDQGALYRVDKFVVPPAARAAFLDRVTATHAVLRAQPGFVRDLVLEQNGGPGEFNVVTLVEWENAGVVAAASGAVARAHAEAGFDRQAFLAANGIRADIANYGALAL